MSFLFGSQGQTKQLPTMNPEQMQFLQQFLGQIGGAGAGGFGESMDYLRNLLSGDPSAFSAFEAPYQRQFSEQTIPQLAERLTGEFGAGGGRSSGATQMFAREGGRLQEQLAALRAQLQGQAAQQLQSTYMSGANQALGARPFGYQYEQGDPGLLGYAAGGIGQGIGSGLGGGIGDLLRRLFGGGR